MNATITYPWEYLGSEPARTISGHVMPGKFWHSARCLRLGTRYHERPLIRLSQAELAEQITQIEAARRECGEAERPVKRWGVYADKRGFIQVWAYLPRGIEPVFACAQTEAEAIGKLRGHCLALGFVLPDDRRQASRPGR